MVGTLEASQCMQIKSLLMQGDEWEEKWGEWWASLGRANKWAEKWAKDGTNVWHEKWGEEYDGEGGCVKYTDKVPAGLQCKGTYCAGDAGDRIGLGSLKKLLFVSMNCCKQFLPIHDTPAVSNMSSASDAEHLDDNTTVLHCNGI